MNKNEEKLALLKRFADIHKVNDFDPTSYIQQFENPKTNEKYSAYPVKIQLGWFRMDNPDAGIQLRSKMEGGSFIAVAKIYKSYTDDEAHCIAEATAQRTPTGEMTADSARAWAQTAALGYALEMAGYGINPFTDSYLVDSGPEGTPPPEDNEAADSTEPDTTATAAAEETPIEKAKKLPCPISQLAGKTLGDLIECNKNALVWLATQYGGDPAIREGAKLICDNAMQLIA